MTGVKQSADEFIEGLKNGTFNYYSAEHEDIVVSVDGDEATMTGKSRVVAAVYDGGKGSWRLQPRKMKSHWILPIAGGDLIGKKRYVSELEASEQ